MITETYFIVKKLYITLKMSSKIDLDSTFPDVSRVEYDVNLACQKCVNAVKDVLGKLDRTEIVEIDIDKQRVIVETSLPSQVIKETIESTGKRAVLKGFGGSVGSSIESAVAELKGDGSIFGVIRFHQTRADLCVIDGTVDGLPAGEHGLHIYEYGDLSDGFNSIGSHFNPTNSSHGSREDKERHYGDLGNITANTDGRASFRMEDGIVKVPDIIGRAIGITENADDLGKTEKGTSEKDGNCGKGLACAIIARSAGLFKNPKRLCQCDGIGIWDENQQTPSASL